MLGRYLRERLRLRRRRPLPPLVVVLSLGAPWVSSGRTFKAVQLSKSDSRERAVQKPSLSQIFKIDTATKRCISTA